jgi:hypothetical protein
MFRTSFLVVPVESRHLAAVSWRSGSRVSASWPGRCRSRPNVSRRRRRWGCSPARSSKGIALSSFTMSMSGTCSRRFPWLVAVDEHAINRGAFRWQPLTSAAPSVMMSAPPMRSKPPQHRQRRRKVRHVDRPNRQAGIDAVNNATARQSVETIDAAPPNHTRRYSVPKSDSTNERKARGRPTNQRGENPLEWRIELEERLTCWRRRGTDVSTRH